MKFLAVTAALISLGMAPGAAYAHATAETLTLDLHHGTTVKTEERLELDTWYVATVQGTASFHFAGTWSHPERIFNKTGKKKKATVCGTPEPAPMFASPGTTSGPVGFDAETLFARPVPVSTCTNEPAPRPTRRFQLNEGARWHHLSSLSGRFSTPRPDHAYSYALLGRDHKLSFRVRDNPSYDNYGQLKITLRPAVATDCGNRQWRNFFDAWDHPWFTDEAECLAEVAPTPATAT
jgi:hypothetical protein